MLAVVHPARLKRNKKNLEDFLLSITTLLSRGLCSSSCIQCLLYFMYFARVEKSAVVWKIYCYFSVVIHVLLKI